MNLLISGCTCSGKTTLANKISKLSNKSVCVVSQDWYYKDKCDIPTMRGYLLIDSPNAFHIDEFLRDSSALVTNNKIRVPTYSIDNNKRLDDKELLNAGVINIFEGLHTVDILKGLRDSIKVYIDTDIETCLKRRIERDKKYNLSEKTITEYFFTIVFPMYKAYIEKQQYEADYIIKNRSDEECMLKKLTLY